MKGGGKKTETFEDPRIPELEAAMLTYRPRDWSLMEEAIMRRYYGKVDRDLLLKYLPGRDIASIRSKAQHMRIATSARKRGAQ